MLLRWSARIRLPRWTSSLLLHETKLLKIGNAPRRGSEVFDLLAMRKPGFEEDLQAIFGSTQDVRIWGIRHRAIKAVASAFLPASTADNNYARSDQNFSRAKCRCRAYWRRVWPALARRVPFRGALAANHAYWAEQELAGAMESRGVPFIALHKESFKSTGFYDFCERLTAEGRAPFQGRLILVYCEKERQVQLAAGVAAPEKILVSGMPRMDLVHQRRRQHAARTVSRPPTILFFAFTADAGLPGRLEIPTHLQERLSPLERELVQMRWEILTPQLLQMMLQIARDNPNVQVIMRAKKPDIPKICQWLGTTEFPDNFHITHEGDLADLLAVSDVACGLASTALVEAIAFGLPTYRPSFAEAGEAAFQPYVPDYGGLVEVVDTPTELARRLVEQALRQQPVPSELTPAATTFLREAIGNPDGEAGSRARASILQEIQRSPR